MVAVKRLGEDYNRDKRHCLSLPSLQENRVNAHLNLPFNKDKPVHGMSCRGMLYFYDSVGNSVICNITAGQIKTLSPPILDPLPDSVIFGGCGIGYDARYNDYKVIRGLSLIYAESDYSYFGSTVSTELYSLNSDTWNILPSIDAFVDPGNPVYTEGTGTGCCYWLAALGEDSGGSSYSTLMGCVSFDFTTETYGHFHLPESEIPDPIYTLVTFGDSLGVVVSLRLYDESFHPRGESSSSSAAQTFLIYSWEVDQWMRYYDISVHYRVQRPLSIINDRFMFVEYKRNHQRAQLAVHDHSQLALYDLHSPSPRLKRFDIFSHLGHLNVFSIDESCHRLINARYYSYELFSNFFFFFTIMI